MTLVWLKNAFPLYHLSWLFKIPISTVSRHLISWVNFLYFKLGSIPIWPSKEDILETLPTNFKKTYPNTRCIFGCTELLCQSPFSLNTQSCLYSSCKSHVTYKGLVGIAPSGAVNCMTAQFLIKKLSTEVNFWKRSYGVMATQ